MFDVHTMEVNGNFTNILQIFYSTEDRKKRHKGEQMMKVFSFLVNSSFNLRLKIGCFVIWPYIDNNPSSTLRFNLSLQYEHSVILKNLFLLQKERMPALELQPLSLIFRGSDI